MFTLRIQTDNAAFEDDPTTEVIRLLNVTTTQLQDGYTSGVCRDSNGNTVGGWDLDE